MDTPGIGAGSSALLQAIEKAIGPAGVDRAQVAVRILGFGSLTPLRPHLIEAVVEEGVGAAYFSRSERGVALRVVPGKVVRERLCHRGTIPLPILQIDGAHPVGPMSSMRMPAAAVEQAAVTVPVDVTARRSQTMADPLEVASASVT